MVGTHGINQIVTTLGRWLIAFSLCVLVLLVPASASASIAPEPPFPITAIEWQGQYARLPDWSQITLRSLPPMQSAGGFTASTALNQAAGYDLSRQWQAGQTADTYLKLGDLQTSLYPQLFNLYTLAQATHFNPSQVALAALEPAAWQTIHDLVTAVPGLGNERVQDVPPIQQLLLGQASSVANLLSLKPNVSIAALLEAVPALGQLSLGQLGKGLKQFALTDIPGLQNIPLQNLAQWENSRVAGIPGLANVPLAQMPNPLAATGMLGTVDVVYGPAEHERTNTISGSHEQGFEVPCQANCAHVEFAGTAPLSGKQWISGKYQQVKGGTGVLATVHGGLEPTGRHPFGDVFKVSVWDVDEATGTVSTALHFRICKRGVPDLGCTPYFLGPIPFLNYREKQPLFTGPLDSQGGASSGASIPEGLLAKASAMGIPAEALPGDEPDGVENSSLCGTGPGGIDFKALAAAFSSIEGNYKSVGTFVCDGSGNCGRGLGRFQYMSYRADVRSTVRHQAGGAAFLSRLDAGEAISGAEVERLFPAAEQDRLFRADQTRSIQQARQEGFSGGRLIERVGQIHFGGPAAPIDGGASDIHGRLTLQTYGQQLRAQYERAAKVASGRQCLLADDANTNSKALKGTNAAKIAQVAQQMKGMDTSAGPDGGNQACAWSVNRVLKRAIGRTIGSNPNYVPSVEAALQSGAGTPVNASQAVAGDIVIASNQAHIGICQNTGCTSVLSNSSSRARFSWESSTNFDGYYGGRSSRIYRVKN